MVVTGSEKPPKKKYFGIESILNEVPTYPADSVENKIPTISSEIKGLYYVNSMEILCPGCGKKIGKNYLKQHQNSGACSRKIQRDGKFNNL